MMSCSDASCELAEPLAGTAPEAASWVVLEQPGPWGRHALTDSHLDPVLGEALEVAAAAHSTRIALVRRPGRHPDSPDPSPRRLWIANTNPHRSWLLGGWVDDVTDLGQMSWSGIETGDRDRVSRSMPELHVETEPLLLVCTNGRRDVCCALKGRALVAALHDRLLGRVWETTHLSGHRFAPTAVVLPSGLTYGRLEPNAARRVFEQACAGRFVADGYRGRSTFSRPGQAAEAAVRTVTGERDMTALDVVSVDAAGDSWRVVVAHRDGRRWLVRVIERRLRPARPESCNAAAANPVCYEATPPTRID